VKRLLVELSIVEGAMRKCLEEVLLAGFYRAEGAMRKSLEEDGFC